MTHPTASTQPSTGVDREGLLALAKEAFEHQTEKYHYWARYITVSLPLVNAGGIAAVLQALSQDGLKSLVASHAQASIGFYLLGLSGTVINMFARLVESLRHRPAYYKLRLRLLAGETPDARDLELFKVGGPDVINYIGWAVSLVGFCLATWLLVGSLTPLAAASGSH